jgi:hypothetical protein
MTELTGLAARIKDLKSILEGDKPQLAAN